MLDEELRQQKLEMERQLKESQVTNLFGFSYIVLMIIFRKHWKEKQKNVKLKLEWQNKFDFWF